MEARAQDQEERCSGNLGKIRLGNKTVLIPEMSRSASLLIAAALRGFGVDARVLETYKGLDLGKEFTSGKECYPCQLTLGDILFFVQEEKERLGPAFDPGHYVYFLPESNGPCLFGLYNQFQRIVPGMEEAIRRMEAGEDPDRIEAEMGDLLEGEDMPFRQRKIAAKGRRKAPLRDETLYTL